MQPSGRGDSVDLHAVPWTKITGVIQSMLNSKDYLIEVTMLMMLDSCRTDCFLFSSLSIGRLTIG